jgi:thioesterase domain-containing protein
MYQSLLENDIKTIVGGQFTEDALGPTAYNEVLSRVCVRSSQYLDTFEAMFLGLSFDAVTQSNLYLPTFLELLQKQEQRRVTSIADRLLRQYDAVMIVYDRTMDHEALQKILPDDVVHLLNRLETRRTRLRMILR